MNGCCGSRRLGFRGLGQDDISDETNVTDVSDLAPTDVTPIIATPVNTISPITPVDTGAIDLSNLPLAPSAGTDVSSLYPASVGTEFVSNGDGTYTNIQTGQSVPYATAQAVTAATTGSATASVATQSATLPAGTFTVADVVDPSTGTSYSGTLTAAASALQATGQLVTAGGQLTAAGQALAAQGQLTTAAQAANAGGVTAALNSLSTWFGSQTLMAGVPNGVLLGGFVVALMILPSLISSKPKRKR
jgi:hypothetical protein